MQRKGAGGAGRAHGWGGVDPPNRSLKDHLDPARPAVPTQARSPAFPGGRADPVLLSGQPTAARAWHLSAPPRDKQHMTRLSGQPALPGRAHEDPAPAPQPDTFLRGRPSLPSPSSHFAAAGLPERLARRTETNFPGSGRRERGDPGPVRGCPRPSPGPRAAGGRFTPRGRQQKRRQRPAPARAARAGAGARGGEPAGARTRAGGGAPLGAGPGRAWNYC